MKRIHRYTGMGRTWILIIATVFVISGHSQSSQARQQPFLRGVALGMYSDIRKSRMAEKLRDVKKLGADHVSLVVSWSSRDVRSTEIAPRKSYTTPDKVLLRMISQAKALGLKVFLFPILDVQRRKPLEWRGTLKPRDWDAWWRSYHRFILHYARIAAQKKVALFCVGSELVSTEGMTGRWEKLIAQVRRVYRGRLVYSANWDHYTPVTFWSKVDLMGITGYYKIARKKDAGEGEMVAAWTAIRKKLSRWSRKSRRSFIFTELGYPSMDGAAIHPWDYTLSSPPDLEEQRRAYSSFVKAWRGSTSLAGVFFWDWYGKGGPTCTRYTPRGKPAANVIRRWFSGRIR